MLIRAQPHERDMQTTMFSYDSRVIRRSGHGTRCFLSLLVQLLYLYDLHFQTWESETERWSNGHWELVQVIVDLTPSLPGVWCVCVCVCEGQVVPALLPDCQTGRVGIASWCKASWCHQWLYSHTQPSLAYKRGWEPGSSQSSQGTSPRMTTTHRWSHPPFNTCLCID